MLVRMRQLRLEAAATRLLAACGSTSPCSAPFPALQKPLLAWSESGGQKQLPQPLLPMLLLEQLQAGPAATVVNMIGTCHQLRLLHGLRERQLSRWLSGLPRLDLRVLLVLALEPSEGRALHLRLRRLLLALLQLVGCPPRPLRCPLRRHSLQGTPQRHQSQSPRAQRLLSRQCRDSSVARLAEAPAALLLPLLLQPQPRVYRCPFAARVLVPLRKRGELPLPARHLGSQLLMMMLLMLLLLSRAQLPSDKSPRLSLLHGRMRRADR